LTVRNLAVLNHYKLIKARRFNIP